MHEIESRTLGATIINRRQSMTRIPIDDTNLPEELELARKIRVKNEGHPLLADAREALERSYLSTYCVTQIVFELRQELLDRQEGDLDIAEIFKLSPHQNEVEIFMDPKKAFQYEIKFFTLVAPKNAEREQIGITTPVPSDEWASYITSKANEMYPRKSS